MSTAVFIPESIDLAVAAVRTNWLIPNPTQAPAAQHGLILSHLSASEDTTGEEMLKEIVRK